MVMNDKMAQSIEQGRVGEKITATCVGGGDLPVRPSRMIDWRQGISSR